MRYRSYLDENHWPRPGCICSGDGGADDDDGSDDGGGSGGSEEKKEDPPAQPTKVEIVPDTPTSNPDDGKHIQIVD